MLTRMTMLDGEGKQARDSHVLRNFQTYTRSLVKRKAFLHIDSVYSYLMRSLSLIKVTKTVG